MDKVSHYFAGLMRGENFGTMGVLKKHVQIVLKHYPPQNLVRQFWLASHGATLSPDINSKYKAPIIKDANFFLSQEIQNLEKVIDDPSIQFGELSKLLHSYILLQTVPPSSMMSKILHKFDTAMKQGSPDGLFKLPMQLSELGVYPGDKWMDSWWDATAPKTKKLDVNGGYAMLYRLAQLDFLRSKDCTVDRSVPSPCHRVADGFLNYIEKNAHYSFGKTIDSRIFFAAKWFGRDFIKDYKVQPECNIHSRSESVFAKAVEKSHITVNVGGIIIPDIDHTVDYELVKDKSYGAEYDGVLHFNRVAMAAPFENALAFNTSTRFQSDLIAKASPELKILRVPYFHGDATAGQQPWQEVLEMLDKKKPGVYAYHGNGQIKNMADKNGHLFRDQPL